MPQACVTEWFDIFDDRVSSENERVRDMPRLPELMARSKAASDAHERREEEERRLPPSAEPQPRRRDYLVFFDKPETWPPGSTRYYEEKLMQELEYQACGRYMNPDWSAEDNALAQRWAQEDLGWAVGEAPVMAHNGLSNRSPASAKPDLSTDELVYLDFTKGEPVPDWIEEAPYPGVFGVDVQCVIGRPSMIIERHPGLFHLHRSDHYDHPHSNSDTEPMFYMEPARPLQPGECLIRYPGAAFSKARKRAFRGATRFRGVRSGGPDAVIWLEDGDDALQYARPLQPLFRPQSEKPEIGRDRVVSLHLSKGERVPDWIELTTYPGVFEVDVLCAIGVPKMILERHPGLFPDSWVRDWQGAEIVQPVICLTPVRSLAPGQCLIRYLGAAISWRGRTKFRSDDRLHRVWRSCGPDSIRWLDEGNDTLLYAHPERLQITAGPKAAVPLNPVHELRLSKGERVPDWIEVREPPGVFGVDVLCLAGKPRAILDRYPGLFHFDHYVGLNPEEHSDGDPMLHLAPAEPLKPGECLIHYPGAAFSKNGVLDFQSKPRCWIVRSGGPEALVWLEEGDDALHYARPLRPRFRPQQERPTIPAGEVCYLDFWKGEKVPDWMEVTSHPGVFEVDVRAIMGARKPILARHPGLFGDYGDASEVILHMAPTESLRPGECVFRYLGAAITQNGYPALRREEIGRVMLLNIEETVGRVYDGHDILFHVHPVRSA